MFDRLRSLINRPKSEPNDDDIVRAKLSLDILAGDILKIAEKETANAPSGATLTTFLSEEHHGVDHEELFASLERLAPEYGVQVVERSGISYTFRKN